MEDRCVNIQSRRKHASLHKLEKAGKLSEFQPAALLRSQKQSLVQKPEKEQPLPQSPSAVPSRSLRRPLDAKPDKVHKLPKSTSAVPFRFEKRLTIRKYIRPSSDQLEGVNALYLELRRQKIRSFQQPHSMPPHSLPSSIPGSLGPAASTVPALETRNILTRQQITPPSPATTWQEGELKRILGDVYVELTPAAINYLRERVGEYARGSRSKASWSSDVYEGHFFKDSLAPADGNIINRLREQAFVWAGPGQNTAGCPQRLPTPAQKGGSQKATPARTHSSTLVVQKPSPPSELDADSYAPCVQVDFSYTARPIVADSVPSFQLLPAYNSAVLGDAVYVPPYLYVTVARNTDELPRARKHMAYITACALHDRLLLRNLSPYLDPADGLIAWDPALSIYAITCCAQHCHIHHMAVHEPWSVGDPIKYALTCVAMVNLTVQGDIQKLQVWLNHIHHFGVTKHSPTAVADASKVSDFNTTAAPKWKTKPVTFYYSAQNKVITTHQPASQALVLVRDTATAQRWQGQRTVTTSEGESSSKQMRLIG